MGDPPLVKLESFTLQSQEVRQVMTLTQSHLGHMHVCGQLVLSDPSHVLPRSDVNLRHPVRRILVEDDGEVACVHTPSHVLLEWTLTNSLQFSAPSLAGVESKT